MVLRLQHSNLYLDLARELTSLHLGVFRLSLLPQFLSKSAHIRIFYFVHFGNSRISIVSQTVNDAFKLELGGRIAYLLIDETVRVELGA